jgi:predicted Ser/Thr protein kinase
MRKRSISSLAIQKPDANAGKAESDETVFAPARAIQEMLSRTIADAPRLECGHVLNGRFVLEQRLGEGGMGTVFKALDLRKQEAQDRNPFVALKVLNQDFRHHPEAVRSLQREAKKAQTLAHPNVITVHDFDRDGPTLYMTMEYLPGQSLDDIVRAEGFAGLPTQHAFKIVRDIGAALVYAHENGIIHLDLKPANVILAESGRTKVIDFGIARAVARPQVDHGDDTVFDAGVLNALTPTYASPEMLANEPPDPRDDVFALACIAYELLAGRHPFARVPATEARKAGLRPSKPPALSTYQWRALQRGLSFDRDLRTQSVVRFVAEVTARPWWHRNALPLIGVAALLAGVAASTLYFEETAPERIGVDAPTNPAVSQVDWMTEMQNRLAGAAEQAVHITEASERVRLEQAQAAARSAALAQADRDGVEDYAARKVLAESAALQAAIAELDRQTAVAKAAAIIARTEGEARKTAVDRAAELAGSKDAAARAAAAAEVTRLMGAANEANRIAAAEEAARIVADEEVKRQAVLAVEAARNAAEAAIHDLGPADAIAAPPKTEADLTREERTLIQKRLRVLGFYGGGVDGTFGPVTRQGIRAYQQANNLAATGLLEPNQIAELLRE